MTLDLLVLVKRQQLNERLQETRVDDRRLVGRVDGNVSDASGGGENEREVGRVQETEKRGQTVGFDDFELVFLCTKRSLGSALCP
jgi:hypothetical protein